MKKVTVVTATYNRGHYNLPSIQSILSQTYQDFQYLVINDGSTDSTAQILDDLKHPNLTVINQTNKGFVNTMVDALESIDTPYIAIQGSGDLAHPERLEKQVSVLDADPSVGAVGCQIHMVSHDGQLLNTWTSSPYLEDPLSELLVNNYFSHGEVMFRCSAYRQAGGYRRFFKFAQDYDLWLRMAGLTKLARVDEFLYNRVMLPNASISCDYRKVELQLTYAAFAVHLAKQRLAGNPDELESLGETAFTNFRNALSQEIRNLLSHRLIVSAKFNYRQTRHHEVLAGAARRALDLNPNNRAAQRYLRLTSALSILDQIGLRQLSQRLDNLLVEIIDQRQHQRMASKLQSAEG